MKRSFATFAAAVVVFGAAAAADAQVSFGITIGAPPPPRVYRVLPPPAPGYEWVEGYWYPQGSHYRWHDGYWTLPPYAGAYWVEPYYLRGQYFAGHWEGRQGRFEHDHRWDRSRERDERRYDRRNERR